MKRTFKNPFVCAVKTVLIITALPLVIAAVLIWYAVIFGKAMVETVIKKQAA